MRRDRRGQPQRVAQLVRRSPGVVACSVGADEHTEQAVHLPDFRFDPKGASWFARWATKFTAFA